MTRRTIIALLAVASTAVLAATAFGQSSSDDLSMVSLVQRNDATATPSGQAFYVTSKDGKLDPWILNLIARKGYRVVRQPEHVLQRLRASGRGSE